MWIHLPMKVNINKKDTRLHGLTRKLQTFSIIASLREPCKLRVRLCKCVSLFINIFFHWYVSSNTCLYKNNKP